MIYFTSLSDTPETIAKDLSGSMNYSKQALADNIRNANRKTMAARYGCYGAYHQNRPIWIPGFSSIDQNPPVRDSIVRRLDSLPLISRQRFAQAMRRGRDLNPIIAASNIVKQSNRNNHDQSKMITGALAAGATLETAKRTVERVNKQAEHFSSHMEKLNELTQEAAKAHKTHGVSSDIFKTARTKLRAQHEETVRILNKRAKLFINRVSPRTQRLINSASLDLQLARKKGIYIKSLDDVKKIEKIARYGEWLGRSLFAFSVVLGADEVYKTYEDGGDAFAKACGITFEMGAAAIAGMGLGMMFTPAGWAVLITTAVIEGATLTAFGTKFEHAGEFIGKEIEHIYSWVKNTLKHWL